MSGISGISLELRVPLAASRHGWDVYTARMGGGKRLGLQREPAHVGMRAPPNTRARDCLPKLKLLQTPGAR